MPARQVHTVHEMITHRRSTGVDNEKECYGHGPIWKWVDIKYQLKGSAAKGIILYESLAF